MMKGIVDTRIALSKGTVIDVAGKHFVIQSEIGRGSTSIVYSVCPLDSNSLKSTEIIVLKEVFPLLPGITRNKDGYIVSSVRGDEADCLLENIKKSISAESEKANIFAESDLNFQIELSISTKKEDNQYILLRKIPGTSLATFLSENIENRRSTSCNPSALPYIRKTLMIVEKLLCNLVTIHKNNFLFLDLKPQNIIVNDLFESMQEMQVCLIDFNSPINMEELPNNNDVVVLSTPGYAAPELEKLKNGELDFSDLTFATDLYSVTRILYELIVGFNYIKNAPRYNGLEKDEILQMSDKEIVRHIDNDIHISMLYTGRQNENGQILPIMGNLFERNLKEVIKKGLMNDPGKRFQSALDMLVAIRSLLSDLDFEEYSAFISSYKRNPCGLIGREEELRIIRNFFLGASSDGHNRCTRIFTISGQYGTGKTALAQAFAEAYGSRCYDAIIEVNSDSFRDSMVQVFINGIVSSTAQASHVLIRSIQWKDAFAFVKNCTRRQRLLLIIDNYNCRCDDGAHYFADLNCDIIITGTDASEVIRESVDLSCLHDQINLGEHILDIQNLLKIFKYYYGYETTSDETIIKIIKNHLISNVNATVCLAKTMAGKNGVFTSPEEELFRIENMGFEQDDARTIAGQNKNICDTYKKIFFANRESYCREPDIISTIRLLILTTDRYGISALHFSTACNITIYKANALLSELYHMGLLYFSEETRDPFDLIYHKFIFTKVRYGVYTMPQVFRDSWCKIPEIAPSFNDSYCLEYVKSIVSFFISSSEEKPKVFKEMTNLLNAYLDIIHVQVVSESTDSFLKMCLIGSIYQSVFTRDAFRLQLIFLARFLYTTNESHDYHYLHVISALVRFFTNEPLHSTDIDLLDYYSEVALNLARNLAIEREVTIDRDPLYIDAQNDRFLVERCMSSEIHPTYLSFNLNMFEEKSSQLEESFGSNLSLKDKVPSEYITLLKLSIWYNFYLDCFVEHGKKLLLSQQYNECLYYLTTILTTVEMIAGPLSTLSIKIREYIRDCYYYIGEDDKANHEDIMISEISGLMELK